MLIVFLFALSFFAIHSLVERSVQLRNANLDRQWTGASGAISRSIHELQRERGLSSGFIASRGERFGDLLIAQQGLTDSSLNELRSVIRAHAAGQAIVTELDAGSKQIHELRPRISNLELSRDYTVDSYTEIVDALFNLQLSTFGNAKETSIFRKQMALIAFSQAKESAGLERALLSAILSDHNFSAGRMLTLSNIRATEQARLANFVRLADPAAAEQFRGIMDQSYIKDAERIRLKVKAAALLYDTNNSELAARILSASSATPESWFEISSAKINAMKVLEDSLVTGVGVSAEEVEKQAWQDLAVSGLLVLLSFVLAGILIRQIQRGRRVAEHQLNLAEAVFTNSVESILVTDAEQRIVEVNPAFLKISGYGRSEIIGQHARVLKSGRHDAAFFDRMWREINDSGAWVGEIWNRRKNGEIYPALLSIAAVNGPDGKISTRACAEFCVNGLLAGNCRIVRSHNEHKETRRP